MGARGPAPKRSDQRRRRNKPQEPTKPKATGAANYSRVPVPRGEPSWHPVAKRWYSSLKRSAQAQFYEPSDWAIAGVLAETLSRELYPEQVIVGEGEDARVIEVEHPVKGATLAALLKGYTALMATEGDRRRLHLEIQRPEPTPAEGGGSVSWIDDARDRFGSAG